MTGMGAVRRGEGGVEVSAPAAGRPTHPAHPTPAATPTLTAVTAPCCLKIELKYHVGDEMSAPLYSPLNNLTGHRRNMLKT